MLSHISIYNIQVIFHQPGMNVFHQRFHKAEEKQMISLYMKVNPLFFLLIGLLLMSQTPVMAQNQDLWAVFKSQTGKNKIETGLKICDALSENPEEHLRFSLDLVKTAKKSVPNSFLLAKTYRSVGDAYYYTGDLDKSNEYLLFSIAAFESSGSRDTTFLGSLYSDLGLNYQEQDKLLESENSIKQAIRLLSSTKDLGSLADAKSNLASLYHEAGKFAEAIRYFKEVNEIDMKLGDPVKQSGSLNSLGRMYVDWGKFEIGRKYYFKSINILDTVKHADMLAIRYNNLGMAYQLENRHREAINWIEKARAIEEKEGNAGKLAIRFFNLGNSWLALKNYPQAEKFLLKANENFARENKVKEMSKTAAALGDLYFLQGNFKKAYSQYRQAEKLAEMGGFLPEKSTIYNKLYQYFKGTGDFENALKYLDKHVTAKDSIFNLSASKQIEEMEIQYQTSQKELEITQLETQNELAHKEVTFRKRERNVATIVLLILVVMVALLYRLFRIVRKQKQILAVQNTELEKLTGIQNQIFSIISHDFRSITSSYQASAKIIEYYLNKGQPEKLLPIASEIGKNSRNLSTMLENLLHWAMIKRKGLQPEKKMLSVAENVDLVAEVMKDQFLTKNNSLHTSITDVKVWCDPESLNIILRNLLANANKFTQDGQIRIEAWTEESHSFIKICDTGTGMTEDALQKLFQPSKDKTRQGTAGEKGTGIGLLLVKEHLKENSGEIKASSTPGKGTCFEIKLPNSGS
jgi:signal transduction histidine kinase